MCTTRVNWGRLTVTVFLAVVLAGCLDLRPPVYSAIQVGDTVAALADQDGTFHVLYSFNTTTERGNGVSYVYYATGTPTAGFSTTRVFDGDGSPLSVDALAQESNGTLHGFVRQGRVIHELTGSSGGSWSTAVFFEKEAGPVGQALFDADGALHVVHATYKTDTLAFDNLRPAYSYRTSGGDLTTTALSVGGGWVDVNYGRRSDIALDADGRAHVVFGCEGNPLVLVVPKLYYTTVEPGGGAAAEAVVHSGSATGTVDCGISIAGDGVMETAHHGYERDYDGVPRCLRSADGGSTWLPSDTMIHDWPVGEAVDLTGDSGYRIQIEHDDANGTHLAYCRNRINEDTGASEPILSYAYRATVGQAWELSGDIVDTYMGLAMAVVDGVPYVFHARPTDEWQEHQGEDTYVWPMSFIELVVTSRAADGSWHSQLVQDTTLPE